MLIVVAATTLTTKLSAQNPIPSFNVPVITEPTTFEESTGDNPMSYNYFVRSNPFSSKPMSRGERLIFVDIIDADENNTATSTFTIYSLNDYYDYGPYNVSEGTPFSMPLTDAVDWGVRVSQASQSSEMSVWFE